MSATTRALDIAELELAALRMGRRQRIVGIAMSPAVDGYLRRDPSGKKQDGKGLIDPTEVLGEMAYCQRMNFLIHDNTLPEARRLARLVRVE